jgi:[protein-PII] uridylyltransferase
VAGEPLVDAAAARLGFDDHERRLLRGLVRRHLLLAEVATTRDLEDPATAAYVAERVPDVEMLDLLEVLTEADARATSPQAWTGWRAGLVADLARRVRRALGEAGPAPDDEHPLQVQVPAAVREDPRRVDVQVQPESDGATVTFVSGDRIGLMADVAGALAVLRTSVRSARGWSQGDVAVSAWDVDDAHLDAALLRERLDAVAQGRLDPSTRLRPGPGERLEPTVQVHHDASEGATVLEIRVDDRPGVVHLVCAALARLEISVRSAHVTTLGPQAVDVFYVQEAGAGALSEERAASAVHAIRRALQVAATLDAGRG